MENKTLSNYLSLIQVKNPKFVGVESGFFVVEVLYKYGSINECTVKYFATESEMKQFYYDYHFDCMEEPVYEDFDNIEDFDKAMSDYKYSLKVTDKWVLELFNSNTQERKGKLDL